MEKKFIEIDPKKLNIGSRFNYSIHDNHGNLLVNKGTIMSNSIVDKLNSYKIASKRKIGVIAYVSSSDIENKHNKTDYQAVKIKDAEVKDSIDKAEDIGKRINEKYETVREKFESGDYENGASDMFKETQGQLAGVPITALYNSIEPFKDGYDVTYTHSKNVAMLTYIVGDRLMNLGVINEAELEELFTGALLHDLGKLKIRDIIEKKGALTNEERKIINNHPIYGYELLKEVGVTENIKRMALEHHENGDGSGYPYKKKYNEVLWQSRLVHIVDVYEAMITERGYKEAYLPSMVVETELMGNCYTKDLADISHCKGMYDSELIKIFLQSVPIFAIGTELRLSNGQWGVVIGNNNENRLRPKLYMNSGEIIDLSDVRKYGNLVIDAMKSTKSDSIILAETLNNKARTEFKFKIKQKYKDNVDEILDNIIK